MIGPPSTLIGHRSDAEAIPLRLYTISEAAQALRLSVPTIKRYIYEGSLRSTKLPGGHHRIAESEIERLAGTMQTASALTADGSAEERIAVLEKWVTELEADVERLSAALEVISSYCKQQGGGVVEQATVAGAKATHSVLILGPGCKRCDALFELTASVLKSMGRDDTTVAMVQDLDAITAFGPILTPALVIDDEVVFSGRVPNEATLRALLRQHLG